MKKKSILLASFAVAIACTAGFFGFKVHSNENNDLILLANIEALSNDEATRWIPCYNIIKPKEGSLVYYCGDCSIAPGTPELFSSSSKCPL